MLQCPDDGAAPLSLVESDHERHTGGNATEEIWEGALQCPTCHRRFPIVNGIPSLLPRSMTIGQKSDGSSDAYSWREMELRDEGASSYESHFSPYANYLELHALQSCLRTRQGDVVLDVGSGTGRMTRQCLRAGAEVVAVDLSSTALGIARHSVKPDVAQRLHLLQADARCLPVRPAMFDAAVSCQVLGQIPDSDVRNTVLEEMSRCVRQEARIVLNVHNLDFRRRREGQRESGACLDDREPYFKFFDSAELLAELPADWVVKRLFGLRSLGRRGERLGCVGLLLERVVERTSLSRMLGHYLVLVAEKRVADNRVASRAELSPAAGGTACLR